MSLYLIFFDIFDLFLVFIEDEEDRFRERRWFSIEEGVDFFFNV